MESLVLCETHYKKSVFVDALSLGLGEQRDGLDYFAPLQLWIGTKMHEWREQADRICRLFPQIGCVIVTQREMDDLPPNYFCVTNPSELSDVLGLDFSPSVRNKLETRFFGNSIPTFVRITIRRTVNSRIKRTRATEDSCKGLKRLKESEEGEDCVVCMSHKATVLMTPCSHQNVCDSCARQLLTEDDPKCPLCREPVVEVFRPIKN